MMDGGLHPHTLARLLVPGLPLSGCVRAHLWRDTTQAAGLSERQRESCFPATPMCGLSWMLEGGGWQLHEDGSQTQMPGPCMLGGPRSRPVRFRSRAGVRCFMTAIAPEAFHAITGVDLTELKDRNLPMAEVLDADWLALNARMLAAPDAATCQRLLEDFLLPRWRAHQSAAGAGPGRSRYSGWMEHLGLRAVAAGHGRSLRQVERRIKQWSGQSLRALRRISRAEDTFFQVRQEFEDDGQVLWAALAQDTGYADQAHLCRETRRVTGFSPEELLQRIHGDEAFWPYRIWE